MSFLYPQAFILLSLPVLLFLRKSSKKVNFYLLMLSSIFIIIAIARPILPQTAQKLSRFSTDIVLAIDLSYSMNAKDENPTRFDEAKRRIKELLKQLPNDRFAVIGFTSQALILSPLSADHELLLHLFNNLERDQIITRSTNILSVLKLTTKLSRQLPRQLLIFTDGGDKKSWKKEIEFANENSIKVHISTLGTKKGSMLFEDGTSIKDKSGNIIISRLNRSIEKLASSSSGEYSEDEDITSLADALSNNSKKIRSDFYGVSGHLELYHIPLSIALILFMFGSTTLASRVFVLILLIVPTFKVEASIFDFWYIYKATSEYEKKDFDTSAEYFSKLGDKNWQALLNVANAQYHAGEYNSALKTLERIKTTDSVLKSKIYCAMGNAMLRLKKPRKAETLYFKSLILVDDKKCEQNYWHAHFSSKTYEMSTGEQKAKLTSLADESTTTTKGSKKDKKSKSKAESKSGKSGSGSGKSSKKQQKKKSSKIKLSSKPAPISSKQYELINKKSTNEKTPW